MKKLQIIAILLCSVLTAFSQPKWNQRYQTYIDQYKDIAIEQMLRYNIPASITLAQGLLESGAGQSDLAVKGRNHFGIKCHGWTGAKTYHDDDAKQECFRAYNSVMESYEDHSKFLVNSQRYKSLFSLKRTDYSGWAHGLKAAGYATNPQYAYSLIGIIETYKLYQYDTATTYDKYIVEHSGGTSSNGTPVTHVIGKCNKCYYVIAHKGDTFKSIGEEMGVSYRKLASYNERDKKDVLEEGDIVYLQKKRSKGDKSFKGVPHIVQPGESMYSISQKYAIRLKNLYKLNAMQPDHVLQVGEPIWTY